MSIIQPLTGHTSCTSAYVQADYPYGFKLRCERRCWLERHDRKGYRFVTQTSNPKKPGTWNKPKMSTYTMLAIMGFDEKNHVVWTGCSMYDFDKLSEFFGTYGHAFDADQAKDCSRHAGGQGGPRQAPGDRQGHRALIRFACQENWVRWDHDQQG